MQTTIDATPDGSPTDARIRPRYSIVPEFIIRDARLSPAARVLYAELDGRQGNGPPPRVSRGVLAETLGVTVRTVARALRELVDAGYLLIKRTGRTSQYRVTNQARSRPSVDNSTGQKRRWDTDVLSDGTLVSSLQSTTLRELSKQRMADASSTAPAADGDRVEPAVAGDVPSESPVDVPSAPAADGSSRSPSPLDVAEFIAGLPQHLRPQPNGAVADAVVAAMGNGWTPSELAAAVRSHITNDQARPGLAVQVARSLSTQPAAEHVHRKPAKPAWCGECDERTRLLDIVQNGSPAMMRCPTCHPSSGVSLSPTNSSSSSNREAV